MVNAAGATIGITVSLLLGMVTNIPSTMVVDQFGMIGLLTFIRAAETDPNLVSLALGTDLTTLGLNLNSEVNFPSDSRGTFLNFQRKIEKILKNL